MNYVDERIALLEREYRKQKKEAAATETEEENQDGQCGMTLEEMLEAVRAGSVMLPSGKGHSFETRSYFEEQIPMVLIKNFFAAVKEEPNGVVFVNHDLGLCQLLVGTDQETEKMGIGKWRKQIEDGMSTAGGYAEVAKEIVLENLDYITFRSPTKKGWIYNLVFRIHHGTSQYFGNYNCFEKDQGTYGLMLEAMVLRLNELLSGSS